ncbi:hypothetical protein CORAM0001_0532 [Corynebacterium amycolatum SK46]|nr:hypothetical protein CORAM0001_0532 [Corynebacterium amycolatum SK46]
MLADGSSGESTKNEIMRVFAPRGGETQKHRAGQVELSGWGSNY